jgi:hypothetical protein
MQKEGVFLPEFSKIATTFCGSHAESPSTEKKSTFFATLFPVFVRRQKKLDFLQNSFEFHN